MYNFAKAKWGYKAITEKENIFQNLTVAWLNAEEKQLGDEGSVRQDREKQGEVGSSANGHSRLDTKLVAKKPQPPIMVLEAFICATKWGTGKVQEAQMQG